MTSRYRGGAASQAGPWQYAGDGIEYHYGEQGHELRVILRNLIEREVERIGGEGVVHLAPVVEPLVFTLLVGFDGVIPWSGGPYSWHRLHDEERALPAPLVEGEAVELTVVLVEGSDGIVRAVRSVTLTPDFSLALHIAIRDQAAHSFDEEEYERQADTLHQQWRSGRLVDRACARWSSGRSGTWAQ